MTSGWLAVQEMPGMREGANEVRRDGCHDPPGPGGLAGRDRGCAKRRAPRCKAYEVNPRAAMVDSGGASRPADGECARVVTDRRNMMGVPRSECYDRGGASAGGACSI